MDDQELIAELRKELRGDLPWGTTIAEQRLIVAALAREVRDLHEKVRQLQAQVFPPS